MPLLLPLSFLAFIALGLPDGILGVSWPSMRSALGVPLDALGLLLAVGTSGYILSSFSCGKLLSRMGVGALLAVSTLVTAFSLAGYAAAPAFPVLLGAGFAAGLGGGAVDAALNTYAAFRFPPRLLNWLHAAYSLGALLGPLVMAGILAAGGSWRWGYASVAAVQLVLGGVFFATRATWGSGSRGPVTPGPGAKGPVTTGPGATELETLGPVTSESETSGPVNWAGAEAVPPRAAPSYGETLSLGRVWLGILAFFLYTGVEFSVGQWAYSLLTLGRGLEPSKAGLWVGLFFGGFFGGRVLAGLLPLGNKVRALLLIAPLGMVAGAALARWGGGGWAAAATLGITVVPGLTGVLARAHGLEVIGISWLTCAAAVSLCLAAMGRSLSRA